MWRFYHPFCGDLFILTPSTRLELAADALVKHLLSDAMDEVKVWGGGQVVGVGWEDEDVT